MNKVPAPYLQEILDSISKIESYIAKIENNKEAFEQSVEKQDAVIRRIEVIGEATKRLEAGFKDNFPEIPWRKMTGMRDVLIHDYDEIDIDLIWRVIQDDLPTLKKSIQLVLESL